MINPAISGQSGNFTIGPLIEVTAPNGGEFYAVGSSQDITWNSACVTGNIRLDYSVNGGTSWTAIDTNDPNDGIYQWTVPNLISSVCRIRVSSVSAAMVRDQSNANFTITNVSITLATPNGGESWLVGSNHPIIWSSTNVAGNVRLDYSTNGGTTWTVIDSDDPNDGYYIWSVPNAPSTTCRVKVSSVANSVVNDQSNANFSIAAPSLTVMAPNGGESWAVASVHAITWTSIGVMGDIRLDYSTNGGSTWTAIDTNDPNDGTYSWTVPNLVSSVCRVKVSTVPAGTVHDQSDANFTITNSSITMATPNGGESWLVGSSQTISWASSNVAGNVRLDYSTNGGTTWTAIDTDDPNDGSFTWIVPNTPSTTCRVRVSSVANTAINDQSNANFSIPAPSITVTVPSGGEFWTVGSSQTITWNSSYVTGNIRLDYSTNGGTSWTAIDTNDPNDGSYTWSVPNAPSTTCQVKISSVSTATVYDQSNANFTISNASINVMAPNGGETWAVGAGKAITWTSANMTGNVRLDYSINGGTTWTAIDTDDPNDGSYTWSVPNAPSTTCRVKVSSVANMAVNDQSNANFNIAAPSITVIVPNGGETWAVATVQTITWSSFAVSGYIRLDYSTNGGTSWTVIDTIDPNDGAYSWTVPNVHSSTCRVKVTSMPAATVYDQSDVDFTIGGSLSLTSPAGDVNWETGTLQVIKWNASNMKGDVCLEYSTDSGKIWRLISSRTSNNGQYLWTVPDAPTKACLVRIRSLDDPSTSALFEQCISIVCADDQVPVEPDIESMYRIGETALGDIPNTFYLGQNFPNPFNPVTQIYFGLPETTQVMAQVFDVCGKRVQILADAALGAGRHSIRWDGRDMSGCKVAAGVYFLHFAAGDQQKTIKMLLVN